MERFGKDICLYIFFIILSLTISVLFSATENREAAAGAGLSVPTRPGGLGLPWHGSGQLSFENNVRRPLSDKHISVMF